MKTRFLIGRLVGISISMRVAVWLAVLVAVAAPAQVYSILHNFGGQSFDGNGPETDLTLGGGTLYGTTVSGGTNYGGTIFKINTDGTGYATLLSLSNSPVPNGGMVQIGDLLYGTTDTGGASNSGSIFEVKTDGSGFTVLHSFGNTLPSFPGTNIDGNRPEGDLVTDGTSLYGTTEFGGTNGNGTVFRISARGSGFTVLRNFSATFMGTNNVSSSILTLPGTNGDGARPIGGLVLAGNTLFGTTYHGGTSNGVVFALQTDGSGFTVLKYFSGLTGPGTNSDGAAPVAGLALSGGTLYGVTVGGGTGTVGNVYALNTNGSGFADLHDFSGPGDGSFPRNALLVDGSTLYGSTAAGGNSNYGTIFMLQTNGANFTVLQNFNISAGRSCDAKFVLGSNLLYGTASSGGANGGGVVFGLKVLPQIVNDRQLGMQAGGFGFDLTGISNQIAVIERSTNLVQPVWLSLQTNTLTGTPGYFLDSSPVSGSGAFYRLFTP